MLPGFQPPTWTESLDVEQRISETPTDATLRGLFFQAIVDRLTALGKAAPAQYSGFARYPVREYLELAASAAREIYPLEPLREGLRQLGREVYPAFKDTMAGAAIFAFAGNDFGKVAMLAQKAYEITLTPSRVALREHGKRHIVVELRAVYTFADCLQIGIWEGAMTACRVQGTIAMKVHSPCDVDLEIEWR